MFKLRFQAQFDLKFQVQPKISISTVNHLIHDCLVYVPKYYIFLKFLYFLRFDLMIYGLEDHDAMECATENLEVIHLYQLMSIEG
jgi:hypothetical protein